MESSQQNHTEQLNLFFKPTVLPNKPSIAIITLPENTYQRRINHMAKFKPFHEFQKPLIGFTPESFLDYVETVLPKDHLCRLVKEVVFSLDTEPIEATYSFLGQRTYHPKLLLSVLFYGYATGVRSSRKLAERCLSDHLFIYLMQCYTPDHRTISDFRKNNLKEIGRYFVDIVRIFSTLGYTQIGKIYLDGTKIKGNASAKRTKDRAGFEKWFSEIEEEIATLLKEAEAIEQQEDATCKIDPEQEALKEGLSDRKYLKSKIEEALEIMKEEEQNMTH